MKNKKFLLVLILTLFAYFFSYTLIRQINTTREVETDRCGYDGCTFVYWQQGTPYIIYSPLIHLDRIINHAEYIFTGWKS